MTDTVTTPSTPSTPPPATVDAPIHEMAFYDEQNDRRAAEADLDRKALDRLGSLPAEDAARAAARIQKKRREREGINDPITVRAYSDELKRDKDGDWEGVRSLREASKDLSFSRLMERGSELLNSGYSSDEAVAIVNSELTQGKPSEQPLTKIGLVREDGTLVNELTDRDGPILGMDENVAFKSPKEAARFVGNYRDALARQQQALLDELQNREVAEQQQAEQAAQEVKRSDEVRAAAEQKAKEAEAARAQLAQREAQLQWEQQATDEEKKLVNVYKSWEDWAARTPEMRDFKALEHTRQHNPARFNEIMKQAQRGKEIQARAIARSKELYEVQQARAMQHAAQYQAQTAAARYQYNKAEDEKFNEALKRELPAFANGKAKAVLREAAREELRSMGLTDEQIRHEYNWGSLRSAPAQMLVAKAAVGRLAKNARVQLAEARAPVPPVLTPGTVRPRGAGDIEKVRGLERQLSAAKGTAALKLGAQLTRARRAAGLI